MTFGKAVTLLSSDQLLYTVLNGTVKVFSRKQGRRMKGGEVGQTQGRT